MRKSSVGGGKKEKSYLEENWSGIERMQAFESFVMVESRKLVNNEMSRIVLGLLTYWKSQFRNFISLILLHFFFHFEFTGVCLIALPSAQVQMDAYNFIKTTYLSKQGEI